MGFSLEQKDSESYSAPDPMFISVVLIMAKDFPWQRFERFFSARPVIDASVPEQIFLMRILVLQEILALNDAETLEWVKNQMYLFLFLSPINQPKVPSVELLQHFRNALMGANILEPFRQRCQTLIAKHASSSALQSEKWAFKADNSFLKPEELTAHWVTCPACKGNKLSDLSPPSEPLAKPEPWACCDRCGHSFKV